MLCIRLRLAYLLARISRSRRISLKRAATASFTVVILYHLMLYVEKFNKEREHKEVFSRENIDKLSYGTFGDEIGTMEEVTLLIRHDLLDRVYDRFGLDVNVQRYDDKFALVTASVVPNRAFFGWLVSLDDDVIIVSPENVNADYRSTLRRIFRNYQSTMYWNHYRSLFAYMWEKR